MVIAPLAFAAVGVVPELIAAMSLAAAVSFTTSPASLESSIVSKLGDISVGSYVSTMRPYWLFFVALAIVLAFGERNIEMLALKSRQMMNLIKRAMVNYLKLPCQPFSYCLL